MKTYFRLFMIIVFIGVGYLLYEFSKSEQTNEPPCQPVPFCGTFNPKLDSIAQQGKQVFNSNCAACHKIHLNSTGPKLDSVIKQYKERKWPLYDYLKGERTNTLYQSNYSEENCTLFPEILPSETTAVEAYVEQNSKPIP